MTLLTRASITALILLTTFTPSVAADATITVYGKSGCSTDLETSLKFGNNTKVKDGVCNAGEVQTEQGWMAANFHMACNATSGGAMGAFFVGDAKCESKTLMTAGGKLGGTMSFTVTEYEKVIKGTCAKGINNDGHTKYFHMKGLKNDMLASMPCGVVKPTTAAPATVEVDKAYSVSLGATTIALGFLAMS